MIKITKLSKSYGKVKIVDKLSLEIKKGEIFGFLGPNGAGKTTAMKVIVGLNKPDSGKVEIEKHNLDKLANRQKIGYMPEDPYFYDHLNAKEFLKFMSDLFACHSDRSGGIFQKISRQARDDNKNIVRALPTGRQAKRELNNNSTIQQLNNLLAVVGLSDVGKKPIVEFSKGMKQRLGLAQALVNDPEYLFLDEPLDGLDPIGRLEFKKIFLNLKKEGKTIFFNSHILSDVEEICDSIGIINHGKLVYEGTIKGFCKGKTLEKRFVEVITK